MQRIKSSLEQISSLHNQIHDIINPKYLKKEMKKNLKFARELHKDESIKTPNIVQLSTSTGGLGILNTNTYLSSLKNDLVPHQLNIMLNSDQGSALFRQT